MKKAVGIIIPLALLVFLSVLLTSCGDDNTVTSDQDQDTESIRNSLAGWEAAFNAEDLAAAMSYFSDGFLNDGESKADVQAFYQDFFTQYDSISLTVMDISVTITGNRASVSGTFLMAYGGFAFSDSFDPNNNDEFWGRCWIRESSAWKMYGNQERIGIKASVQHYYPDNYSLGITVAGRNITSVDVTGPNITSVWQHPQASDHTVVNLSTRPTLGDLYNIRVQFSDGKYEDNSYFVNGVNDDFAWITAPADGSTITTTTPTFVWQTASNIDSYHLKVIDDQGTWIWQVSSPSGTSTCVFDYDGSASANLQLGKAYELVLHTFDSNGNQASTFSHFTVQ